MPQQQIGQKQGEQADAVYQQNLSASQPSGSTSAKGTGKNVVLAGKQPDAPKESVAEAAARVKKEKAASPQKKAVKTLGEFKKGGKVKKTGIYKLHKNEVVVPTNKVGKMSALYGK